MKLGQEIRLELPNDLANKKAASSSVLRLRFASKEEAARILNIAHVIGKTRLHLYETKNAEVSVSDGQSLNQSSQHNSSLNLEQTAYPHPEEFEASGRLRPESSHLSHHASQLSATHASSSQAGPRKNGHGPHTAFPEQAMQRPFAAPHGHRAVPEHLQRGNLNTSSILTSSHQRYPPADGAFAERDSSCSAPWQTDHRQGAGLPDPSIAGVRAWTGAAVQAEDQSLSSGRDFDRAKAAVFEPGVTKTLARTTPHHGRQTAAPYPLQAQITSFEDPYKLASTPQREYPSGQTYSKGRQGPSSGFQLDDRSRDYLQSYGDECEPLRARAADSHVYNQVDYPPTSRGNINLNNTQSDYSGCEQSSYFNEVIGGTSQDFRSGDKQQKQAPARRTQVSGLLPLRSESETASALHYRPGMERQGLAPAVISYDGYSSIHPDREYSQESNQFTDSIQSNSLHTGHQERAYNTHQEPASREKLGSTGVSIFERTNEKEIGSSLSEFYSEELAFLQPLGIFIEGRKKWTVNSEHQDFEPLTTDGTHVRFWDEFAINEPFFISKEFSLWNGLSIKKIEDICLGIRIKRKLQQAPDSRASIELKLDIISTTEIEFNELKRQAAEFRKKLTSLMKSTNTRKTWHENYPLKLIDAEEMHLGEHATKSSSESRPLSGCRYEDPSFRKLDQQTAFITSELESSSRISFAGRHDLASVQVPISRNVRSPRKASHNV